MIGPCWIASVNMLGHNITNFHGHLLHPLNDPLGHPGSSRQGGEKFLEGFGAYGGAIQDHGDGLDCIGGMESGLSRRGQADDGKTPGTLVVPRSRDIHIQIAGGANHCQGRSRRGRALKRGMCGGLGDRSGHSA